MSVYLTLLILCAVSAGLLALACISSRGRLGAVLVLIWLAAALPLMFFCGFSDKQVLIFYLASSALAFGFCLGGEKK